MEVIDNRLSEIRLEKGYSKLKLSQLSGVSRPTIINLEAGGAGAVIKTKTETLLKLADALGEPVDKIFFDSGVSYSEQQQTV